jgi:hypothetical protein
MTDRLTNLAAMQQWVRRIRVEAAQADDPDAALMRAHDLLGRRMSHLGEGISGSEGLTAFDLGEAQIALLAPL